MIQRCGLIEIIVVSHANMAEGLVNSVELIMGATQGLTAVGLLPQDSFETFSRSISKVLKSKYNEDGVLIMADLFGGTPCNVSALSINKEVDKDLPKMECISGVNLPMVIEAISMRDSLPLGELKDYCMDAGRNGIRDIKRVFNLNE